MTLSRFDADLSLVPPKRMGRLLANARYRSGVSTTAAAFASYGRFDVLDIRRIEEGDLVVSDDDIQMFAGIYRMDVDRIVPARMELAIDRGEGWVRVGNRVQSVAPASGDRAVLIRYLALIYELRNVRPGHLIVPRENDLRVLGALFARTPSEMRLRLEVLMRRDRAEVADVQDRLRDRLSVPSIGMLVGLTRIGALLLEQSSRPDDSLLVRIPEIEPMSA